MKTTLASALLVLCTVAPIAHADQFEYLTLAQAQGALAKLHRGDVVHTFCAPCGDVASERMTVRTLGIDRVWDRDHRATAYRDPEGVSYWAIELNDVNVDLAYLYVRDGRRWRNLAQWLGLAPVKVPIELPKSVIGTRWRCGDAHENPYLAVLTQRRDPCPIDTAALEKAARADPGWH